MVTPPNSAEELGRVELTDAGAVAGIVAEARVAHFDWRRRPLFERAAILEQAANSLVDKEEDLGRLLAAESGKPLAQAHFEIRASIGLLRANAFEGRRITGTVLPTEANPGTEYDLAVTRREPLGVVAAILPFNFPVELFIEKCAAALIAGNAVVAKPPLEAPLAIGAFHEELIGSGVPSAALALIQGDVEPAAALATAPGVDAISLTGSTAAGIAVARSTAHLLRRLHLELGGNNASLILADADLDLVVAEATRGRLMMNGQACSASKRLIVHESLHDELVERLVAVARAQRVGPATHPETTIGPLINAPSAARVAEQVAAAVAEGATLAAGETSAQNAYFPPAVLAATPTTASVSRSDEIFGPVFTVIPVATPEQALEAANASDFGLMGSVFSADLRLAWALAERLETGGVVINGTDNYRPPVIPFGGVKLSGAGREGIGYTINELSRDKTIVLRHFRDALSGRERGLA